MFRDRISRAAESASRIAATPASASSARDPGNVYDPMFRGEDVNKRGVVKVWYCAATETHLVWILVCIFWAFRPGPFVLGLSSWAFRPGALRAPFMNKA
ncbi:MAG: hypothetical protein EBY17_27160 [Acidobacteriia bacterium]|nr:hypothetical protein [Terriglobia bacterium]